MTLLEKLFIYAIPTLIIGLALILAFKSDLIKEGSPEKHYSLSRTQLLWWTSIILCCFSISYGNICMVPKLNDSILYLLGIGTGTMTVASLMNDKKLQDNYVSFKDGTKSRGLLIDILNDGDGISVHRFQAVLFNVVFGAIFLHQFFTAPNFAFPDFNFEQLGLLGISTSGYLLLKNGENKSTVKTSETIASNNPKANSENKNTDTQLEEAPHSRETTNYN